MLYVHSKNWPTYLHNTELGMR